MGTERAVDSLPLVAALDGRDEELHGELDSCERSSDLERQLVLGDQQLGGWLRHMRFYC